MFKQLRAWLNAPVIALVNERFATMATREETAYSNLMSNIGSVKTGWGSLKLENEQLRAALQQADAAQVQAVDDALAADSEHDAAAIEAADASLAELVAQPEPTPEPAPEGDAPVDGDQPA